MIGISAIAELAALVGDPARASILFALKEDGRISSGELSSIAGVAPSTVSEHLAKLAEAGLVQMIPMGRRRYYRIADPTVADLLEGMEEVARSLRDGKPQAPRLDRARIHARACMDHIAGELGGRLAGAAAEHGLIRHVADGPLLTEAGAAWLTGLGQDMEALRAGPRRFIGLCTDWTCDLPHLGGAVGAALLRGLARDGWVRVDKAYTSVDVTPKGAAEFRRVFGLDVRSFP